MNFAFQENLKDRFYESRIELFLEFPWNDVKETYTPKKLEVTSQKYNLRDCLLRKNTEVEMQGMLKFLTQLLLSLR